jgi:hypothetical protein
MFLPAVVESVDEPLVPVADDELLVAAVVN